MMLLGQLREAAAGATVWEAVARVRVTRPTPGTRAATADDVELRVATDLRGSLLRGIARPWRGLPGCGVGVARPPWLVRGMHPAWLTGAITATLRRLALAGRIDAAAASAAAVAGATDPAAFPYTV
jgi:hypothetical protein